MTRINRDMQVGEALWELGVRDVKDVDAFMRGIFKKAERWDGLPRSGKRLFDESTPEEYIQYYRNVDKAVDKLDAINHFLKKVRDRDEVRVDRSWVITSLEKILEVK